MARRPGGASVIWKMQLDRFPQVTASINQKANEAIEAAKEQLAEGARQRVRVRTGATRDSIEVTDEGVVAGGAAGFLEFGTRKMPAYPFLGPAIEEVRLEFGSIFAAKFSGLG